ncbi:nuclease-related domain-containing protein [Kribbella sp. NPDC023855]|uniref:nuclease-related domain-containing protein n=1 Tax=Kribbella sp. NPDC023855 TaxID=3154698 RepID=UPI0033E1720F
MLRSRGRVLRVLGASPLTADGLKWFRGAHAELAVGRMLSRLDDGWTVLHAVPVGVRGADVDHLVVGPAGVFTINTKNHSGQRVWVGGKTFLVGGVKCDHIRKSEFEATRVARLLSAAVGWEVPVRPVVAVFEPAKLEIKTRPTAVDVISTGSLLRWLRKKPAVLTADEVARINAIIGLPSTWRRTPDDLADLDRQDEFSALRASVRQSTLLRRLWATAIGGTAAAGAIAAYPDTVHLIARRLGELLGA